MNSYRNNQVSVVFQNLICHDFFHTVLDERDDVVGKLMNGSFNTSRDGCNIFLQINTETELEKVRHITAIPLFIKF